MDLVNEFRGRLGDLLNVHPTLSGRHDEHRFGLTVHEKGEVVFVRDGAARFHVQVANELALVPGLDGHQDVSEDVRGIGANLLSGERDFDPAFHDKVTRVGSVQVAFAPAPGGIWLLTATTFEPKWS